jgi:PAP2 superfamily
MSLETSTLPQDVRASWRLIYVNWMLLAAIGAALAASLIVTDFTVTLPGVLIVAGYVGVYAGFAHANARSPQRRDPQVMFVLVGIAQLTLTTALITPLTYVAAATNFPVQDANLLVIDRALGLDWAAYVNYVNDHPLLALWLSYGYSMIRWQLFAVPIVLAAIADYRRIGEFIFAFGLALIVTTIISAFVPAIGVYQQIGLDPGGLKNLHPLAYLEQLHDLPPARVGVLRDLDLFGLSGIVTFPSFHAASVVLYAWALWPAKWMRPIVVLANGAMMAATPIDGGHYFIDLFAGAGVAVLAIIAARRLADAVIARRTARAVPALVPAALPAGAAAA